MPIFASNFTANSLQGTVTVSGGQANVVLPISNFAFEGSKSFVIDLRKEGYSGTVIATSNTISIPDTTTIVSLTANISTVAEGNAILYTLTTTNVVNGTNVFFSTNSVVTANVNSNDFVGGNTGIITINNNVGTLALVANSDLSNVSELAETFALQIRTNNASGNVVVTSSNVLVLDTSNTYAINSLVESSNSIITPSNVTFTVSVSNIPAGTTLYYDTVGTATSSTFNGGNTGSFKINTANTGTNTVVLGNLTLGIGGSGSFALNIRRDSTTGTILATSNTIVISGLSAYYTMTGGTISYSDQYKIHTFTTTANLVITAGSGDITNSNVDLLVVAGGGGGLGNSPIVNEYAGGGAGGLLNTISNFTTALGSSGQYVITIGGGGAATAPATTPGSNSYIGANIFVAIGGGGGGNAVPGQSGGGGKPGGSGGGGGKFNIGGDGFNYPGPAQQGYPGNQNQVPNSAAGGGGGAGGSATNSIYSSSFQMNGGIGLVVPFSPASYGTTGPAPGRYFAGGGGAVGPGLTPGVGGAGGGGPGNGGTGNVNTGGGGGAGYGGGSGIVIIRYPYTAYYANVVETSNLVGKGTNVTFNLSASGANAITLYYSTSGNVDSSHFIGGNTGSFVANVTGGLITLQTNYDTILDGNKRFALQVRTNNTAGNVVVTSGNVYLTNSVVVSYLLVGGGGSAQGTDSSIAVGGGGGAGGVLAGNTILTPGIRYTILVGAGMTDAAIDTQNGARGWWLYGGGAGYEYPTVPAQFAYQLGSFILEGSSNTIIATGKAGGSGGSYWGPAFNPAPGAPYQNVGATAGGSGGGAGEQTPVASTVPGNALGAAGISGQGYPGGNVTIGAGSGTGSAGGGGAGGAGTPAPGGGHGGAAYQWMDGNWYGGGGAGKTGGVGGGGPGVPVVQRGGGGSFTSGSPTPSPGSGVVNTGGGGGAAISKTYPWSATPQSSGGSGIVILRYPNTLPLATSTTGTNTVVYANANIYYRFTGSGTITF